MPVDVPASMPIDPVGAIALFATGLVIDNFSDQFYNLYMEFDLSMTLKTHISIHHYMYFFQKTKKTMILTNGEFHESCHSTLRRY